jgi:hypothetical protein
MQAKTRKIGQFLKALTQEEYIYLSHVVAIRSEIESLIFKHKLDKKRFCELFEIKPNKYNDFVKGNYNYDLHDMARLNAAYLLLEAEALTKNLPVEVKKINNK